MRRCRQCGHFIDSPMDNSKFCSRFCTGIHSVTDGLHGVSVNIDNLTRMLNYQFDKDKENAKTTKKPKKIRKSIE